MVSIFPTNETWKEILAEKEKLPEEMRDFSAEHTPIQSAFIEKELFEFIKRLFEDQNPIGQNPIGYVVKVHRTFKSFEVKKIVNNRARDVSTQRLIISCLARPFMDREYKQLESVIVFRSKFKPEDN